MSVSFDVAKKAWREFRFENLPKVEHVDPRAPKRRVDDGMILVTELLEAFLKLNPNCEKFREVLLAEYPGGSFAISKSRWQATKARADALAHA